MPFKKKTIEIDVHELSEAARNLGTHGVKQTVNTALHEINRRASLLGAAERVRAGKFHAPDEATWAKWREPRR